MSIPDGAPDAEARTMRCPCLSGGTYEECCGPIHRGMTEAPTAERLMRSRFSAFALGDVAYLLESWHPSTRPVRLELDPGLRWYRLDIIGTTAGGILDTTGTVHFRAYHKGDAVGVQEEDSRFVRVGRRWFYLDGAATNV